MNAQQLLTPQADRINKIRKDDELVGALLSDITMAIQKDDYKTAAFATAHLFMLCVRRANLKPYKILRSIS